MAKTKKANRAAWMIAAVLVLLGAYAIGLGIRAVRLRRAGDEPKSKVESTELTIVEPVVESAEIDDAQMEDVEEEYVIIEEAAEEPEVEPEEELEADPGDMPEDEPVEYEAQEERGFGGWREVWSDLDLTEDERARIRDGFRLAMERWQNMSSEEREMETTRLRKMRERWENMSGEDRREASQRMRERLEQWLQSGRIELPELSLD